MNAHQGQGRRGSIKKYVKLAYFSDCMLKIQLALIILHSHFQN